MPIRFPKKKSTAGIFPPKINVFADGQQLRSFSSNVKIAKAAVQFNYHNTMAKYRTGMREKKTYTKERMFLQTYTIGSVNTSKGKGRNPAGSRL